MRHLLSIEIAKHMAAKTPAQRQAELKARRIAAGLVPVTNFWVHPDDVAAIREHSEKLAKRRERAARRGLGAV